MGIVFIWLVGWLKFTLPLLTKRFTSFWMIQHRAAFPVPRQDPVIVYSSTFMGFYFFTLNLGIYLEFIPVCRVSCESTSVLFGFDSEGYPLDSAGSAPFPHATGPPLQCALNFHKYLVYL